MQWRLGRLCPARIPEMISCRQTGNLAVTSWKGDSLLCCNNGADSMHLPSAYTDRRVMCCGEHVQSPQWQSLRASAPSCPRTPRQSWPESCCSWPRQPNTPRFAMCSLGTACVNHRVLAWSCPTLNMWVPALQLLEATKCKLISLACKLFDMQ